MTDDRTCGCKCSEPFFVYVMITFTKRFSNIVPQNNDNLFRMLKFKAVAVKIARKTLVILGCFFLILLVLAFTRIPFDVHRWLGSENSEFDFEPTAIVMLGGSGMPSESNLIRLFYVKELALNFPQARIFILHPQDSSVVAE